VPHIFWNFLILASVQFPPGMLRHNLDIWSDWPVRE
jgi:hypothetical protein